MHNELISVEDLKKDSKKFFEFVEKSKEGQLLDLKGALERNKRFFVQLQSVLDSGSEEEKKEAGQLFKEMMIFLEKKLKT